MGSNRASRGTPKYVRFKIFPCLKVTLASHLHSSSPTPLKLKLTFKVIEELFRLWNILYMTTMSVQNEHKRTASTVAEVLIILSAKSSVNEFCICHPVKSVFVFHLYVVFQSLLLRYSDCINTQIVYSRTQIQCCP